MNRTETLEAALHAVTDRGATYGKPEDVFGMIAELWTAYLGNRLDAPLTVFDVSQLMILLKVARAKNNPQHTDNQVDIAGYAGCANELAEKLRTAPVEPAAANLEKLPLVPEFLICRRVEVGDVLISSKGGRYVFVEYKTLTHHPIITDAPHIRMTWSYSGWAELARERDPAYEHIIRIERNGVTVAEGQIYET